MEEPRNTTTDPKEKNKLVITVGRFAAASGSGLGIGVGIIFLGGVMATTAFAFLSRRRGLKSGNGKNCCREGHSTASTDKNMNEEKGFDAIRKDMDRNLRNESSYSRVNEDDGSRISEEGFFWLGDQKGRLEVNGRNHDDPLSNAIKGDEFPLPIVANKMPLLPDILQNTISTQDQEKMKKNIGNGTAIFDQDTEKGRRDVLVDHEGERIDDSRWEVEDEGELHCQEAAETAKAGHQSMKSSEEKESKIHIGEESKNIGNSFPKSRTFEEGSFRPEPGNLSLCNDGKLGNRCEECALPVEIGIMGKDEELDEAATEDKDKGVSKTHIVEIDDSVCPERFGVSEIDERLDAIREDQGSGSNTNSMMSEVEEKRKENDTSLTIRTEENLLSKDADEFNPAILMSEQSQATGETPELADDHASNGNHQMLQQMEESGTYLHGDNEEDYSAPDELTSESSPSKQCVENRIEYGFKEVQQPAELIQGLREKLQLSKEEQSVKKQALMYLNKVYNDGITGKGLQKVILDRGSLKLSLIGRYIMRLAELTQGTTNSHKSRILVFTVLVLSGSLRVWYFSRPFLLVLLMHLRNYLMIKLHLRIRSYLRKHLRIKIVPKMLGI